MEKSEIKENDLVMLRLCNPQHESLKRKRHYNTWFRAMFIDNDGTFIGRCEKIVRWEDEEFTRHKIGDDVRLSLNDIKHIYKEGEQWCYGDNVTICECSGLCRDK